MPDLLHRFTGMEQMDDLAASGEDLTRALRELDLINALLGGNRVTLGAIAQLISDAKAATLQIADVGCGSGDMLRRVRQLVKRKNVSAMLTGIDANPNVLEFAAAHTPPSYAIHYEQMNILSPEFASRRFDIVTATLFFHHFERDTLSDILRRLLSQVSVGIVINDIHRHWFSYYSIKALTRFFSRSSMVKHDAPVSVMRAFTKEELEDILQGAGIRNFTIRWCWAFRWQVIIRV